MGKPSSAASLPSSVKNPPPFMEPMLPLNLRIRCRPQRARPQMMPTSAPKLSHGWELMAPRISKKSVSMPEVVDFGFSTAGLLTTFGRVSRMDVRDATMGLPVTVWSQYRRFYTHMISRDDVGSGKWMESREAALTSSSLMMTFSPFLTSTP